AVRRIFDQKLDRATQNAALVVNLIERETGAVDRVLRGQGVGAREWFDKPNPDWRFGSCSNDKGTSDRRGSPTNDRRLENRPTAGCPATFLVQGFLPRLRVTMHLPAGIVGLLAGPAHRPASHARAMSLALDQKDSP